MQIAGMNFQARSSACGTSPVLSSGTPER
ncbi:MAG: hypothetical protein ACLVD1_05290 [Lacrimispora saccharolytica]